MSKPTVLIDGIAFENPSQIGIWRVFYEVMKRTSMEVDYVLLLQNQAVHPIPENVAVRNWPHRSSVSSRRHWWRKRKRRVAIQTLEKEYPNAIWHSTYFSPDPRSQSLSVVTVYDCVSEKFFHLDSALSEQTELKQKSLNLATKILAISESTRADMETFYPSLASRITVTRLGCDHLIAPHNIPQSKRPQCLYVGSRNAYKNFFTLVDAIMDPSWPPSIDMNVVGHPFTEDEKRLLRYKGAESRVSHAGFVSDEVLRKLYSESLCFVFPSLAEGFGLPVVESQLCGTVPVISDIPVFREVAGEGAIFFDPTSASSIANAVSKALIPEHELDVRGKAQQNARAMSWDLTARKTLETYLSMIETR